MKGSEKYSPTEMTASYKILSISSILKNLILEN